MDTVVITGANRGIGLGLTKVFLQNHARVIATCRNPIEAKELQALGVNTNLSIYPLIVNDSQSIADFAEELDGRPIDILINNAGVIGGPRQSLEDMDYHAWSEAFEVNTIAPFRLSATLLNNLQHSKHPRIVNVSSQMGALSGTSAGHYAYRSSKAALNKVMQALALELDSEGIIVCNVHPGWVQTDMGGVNAQITIQESAAGLCKLIDSLTMQQTGKFFSWEGEELAW